MLLMSLYNFFFYFDKLASLSDYVKIWISAFLECIYLNNKYFLDN